MELKTLSTKIMAILLFLIYMEHLIHKKLQTQIESFSFSTTTKKEFFVVEKDSGFTLPYDNAGAYLDKQSVAVDGSTTYPY